MWAPALRWTELGLYTALRLTRCISTTRAAPGREWVQASDLMFDAGARGLEPRRSATDGLTCV